MYVQFIFGTLVFIQINVVICKKYDNYTLYRGIPINETQLEFYKNLSKVYDINLWRPPSMVYRPVEFTIGPADRTNFLRAAEEKSLYVTSILDDIQSAFDMQLVKPYIRRKLETFDWESFYRLDDIYNWLRDLSKQYATEVEIEKIGKTHEDRDILAVKLALKGSSRRYKRFPSNIYGEQSISGAGGETNLDLSAVVVEGGIHAREWISPAFVTYMLFTLLHAPDSHNETLKAIAYTYEFYFVPVLNPDGYEYTHTEDRLWRKNRHKTGTDINRNFNIAFGGTGISFDPKSETFCGNKAFSENESSAMSSFLRSINSNIEYYLAFHSYGQYMIIPYAYSKTHEDNYDEVKKMTTQAERRISQKYKTQYHSGTAYDTVGYTTSGVSGCWVKKTFRVPYVVTFELRDEGYYGFALPPKLIKPTCEETMEGVLSLLTPRTSFARSLPDHTRKQLSSGQTRVKFGWFFLSDVLLFIIARFD